MQGWTTHFGSCKIRVAHKDQREKLRIEYLSGLPTPCVGNSWLFGNSQPCQAFEFFERPGWAESSAELAAYNRPSECFLLPQIHAETLSAGV